LALLDVSGVTRFTENSSKICSKLLFVGCMSDPTSPRFAGWLWIAAE